MSGLVSHRHAGFCIVCGRPALEHFRNGRWIRCADVPPALSVPVDPGPLEPLPAVSRAPRPCDEDAEDFGEELHEYASAKGYGRSAS